MKVWSNFRESEHVFVSSSCLELIHELGCGGVDLVLHVDGDLVKDLTQLCQLLPVRQTLVSQYGLNATSLKYLPKMGSKYC
jgi:hypothetical protein